MILKKQPLALILILFTIQLSSAQIDVCLGAVTVVSNYDLIHTDRKLGTIKGLTAARLAANKTSKNKVQNMVEHQTQYLKDRYDKNNYDRKESFISDNKLTIAMTAGSQMAASTFSDTGYYMTKNKREYMENFDFDKTILAFLQELDYDNINTGQRQEIYRLRKELIKQFSYNDRAVMSLFGLPAIHYALENDDALLTLINTLTLLE